MGIHHGGIYGPVSDAAYDATAWDGVTSVAPSKNAVRDKLETFSSTYVALAPAPSGDTSGAADLAAIQAAVDAANVAGGGNVRLQAGIYYINAAIRLYDSVHLWGVAAERNDTTRGTTVRTNNAAACAGVAMIDVQDTLWAGVHMLALHPASGNTCMAISDFANTATQCGFAIIEDNHFEGFGGDCIALYGNANWITRNRADNTTGHFIHQKNGGGLGSGSDSFITYNESGACIGSTVNAAGSAYICDGGAHNTVIGNHFYNFKTGINLNNGGWNQIIGNRCEKNDYDGIIINGASKNNMIQGNRLFNNGYVSSKVGVRILGAASLNSVIGNSIYNEASFDGGTNTATGILLTASSTRNKVGENWIYNTTQMGIHVDGTTLNHISGNTIDTAGYDGIRVSGAASSNQISGNYVYSAGQAADNTYRGIVFSDTASSNSALGNTVRHGGGAAQTQYGIAVLGTSVANNTILNNDCLTAGRTASWFDSSGSSAGTIMRNTRGYTSESTGLATVASGQTTIVVTHGVAVTPTVRNITVVPTNNLGSATKFWISTVTSTQFTINVDVDPGAATAMFVWRVSPISSNNI